MRKAAWLLLIFGLLVLALTNSGLLSLQRPFVNRVAAQLPPANPVVAFVGVSVVPMDGERILADQTVVVRQGMIAEIGDPATVAVPAEALVVAGEGRYLLPGLVDMHVHVEDENDSWKDRRPPRR